MLGLKCAGLNLDNHTVYAHRQIVRRRLKASTKTEEERIVTIPGWVIPYLEPLTTLQKRDYVFINSKGAPHLDTDSVNTPWNEMFADSVFRQKHQIRKRPP